MSFGCIRERLRPSTRLVLLGMANVGVCLALLLGCECVTRALGITFGAIDLKQHGSRLLWTYDSVLGWYHRPGSQGTEYLGGPDRGVIHIDALGLRGGRVELEKPRGTVRVLAVGDSFVFGVGVDEEHVFSHQLEDRLNERKDRRYEVVNMGVRGYSTDQEYLLFRDLGLRLQPDIVILVVCDNDFDANVLDLVYREYYKPYFGLTTEDRLVARNVPVPRLTRGQRAKLWCSVHSNVWNYFRSRSSSVPWLSDALGWFQIAQPEESGEDPDQITAALIRAMATDAHRVGASFAVLSAGHRTEKSRRFRLLKRRLRPDGIQCRGLKAPLDAARQVHPPLLVEFEHDLHWNVDGHRLAADVAYRWLEELGYLARVPSHHSLRSRSE